MHENLNCEHRLRTGIPLFEGFAWSTILPQTIPQKVGCSGESSPQKVEKVFNMWNHFQVDKLVVE